MAPSIIAQDLSGNPFLSFATAVWTVGANSCSLPLFSLGAPPCLEVSDYTLCSTLKCWKRQNTRMLFHVEKLHDYWHLCLVQSALPGFNVHECFQGAFGSCSRDKPPFKKVERTFEESGQTLMSTLHLLLLLRASCRNLRWHFTLQQSRTVRSR